MLEYLDLAFVATAATERDDIQARYFSGKIHFKLVPSFAQWYLLTLYQSAGVISNIYCPVRCDRYQGFDSYAARGRVRVSLNFKQTASAVAGLQINYFRCGYSTSITVCIGISYCIGSRTGYFKIPGYTVTPVPLNVPPEGVAPNCTVRS